jgi:hypothetical protein
MKITAEFSKPDPDSYSPSQVLLTKDFSSEEEFNSCVQKWGKIKGSHSSWACLYQVIYTETGKELAKDLFIPSSSRWLESASKTLPIAMNILKWAIAAFWLAIDLITVPIRCITLGFRLNNVKSFTDHGLYRYLIDQGVCPQDLQERAVRIDINWEEGKQSTHVTRHLFMTEFDNDSLKYWRLTGLSACSSRPGDSDQIKPSPVTIAFMKQLGFKPEA